MRRGRRGSLAARLRRRGTSRQHRLGRGNKRLVDRRRRAKERMVLCRHFEFETSGPACVIVSGRNGRQPRVLFHGAVEGRRRAREQNEKRERKEEEEAKERAGRGPEYSPRSKLTMIVTDGVERRASRCRG